MAFSKSIDGKTLVATMYSWCHLDEVLLQAPAQHGLGGGLGPQHGRVHHLHHRVLELGEHRLGGQEVSRRSV